MVGHLKLFQNLVVPITILEMPSNMLLRQVSCGTNIPCQQVINIILVSFKNILLTKFFMYILRLSFSRFVNYIFLEFLTIINFHGMQYIFLICLPSIFASNPYFPFSSRPVSSPFSFFQQNPWAFD